MRTLLTASTAVILAFGFVPPAHAETPASVPPASVLSTHVAPMTAPDAAITRPRTVTVPAAKTKKTQVRVTFIGVPKGKKATVTLTGRGRAVTLTPRTPARDIPAGRYTVTANTITTPTYAALGTLTVNKITVKKGTTAKIQVRFNNRTRTPLVTDAHAVAPAAAPANPNYPMSVTFQSSTAHVGDSIILPAEGSLVYPFIGLVTAVSGGTVTAERRPLVDVFSELHLKGTPGPAITSPRTRSAPSKEKIGCSGEMMVNLLAGAVPAPFGDMSIDTEGTTVKAAHAVWHWGRSGDIIQPATDFTVDCSIPLTPEPIWGEAFTIGPIPILYWQVKPELHAGVDVSITGARPTVATAYSWNTGFQYTEKKGFEKVNDFTPPARGSIGDVTVDWTVLGLTMEAGLTAVPPLLGGITDYVDLGAGVNGDTSVHVHSPYDESATRTCWVGTTLEAKLGFYARAKAGVGVSFDAPLAAATSQLGTYNCSDKPAVPTNNRAFTTQVGSVIVVNQQETYGTAAYSPPVSSVSTNTNVLAPRPIQDYPAANGTPRPSAVFDAVAAGKSTICANLANGTQECYDYTVIGTATVPAPPAARDCNPIDNVVTVGCTFGFTGLADTPGAKWGDPGYHDITSLVVTNARVMSTSGMTKNPDGQPTAYVTTLTPGTTQLCFTYLGVAKPRCDTYTVVA